MSKCNYCKETNLFMCIEHKLSENNLFVVRVRYDFDCNDRNEFDIQYVEYVKKNKWENTNNNDWLYSFNTNYCPICGQKTRYQKDMKYENGDNSNFKVMINKKMSLILDYDKKNHEVYILFGINTLNNKLQLRLYIDNELVNLNEMNLNYDPITGEKIEKTITNLNQTVNMMNNSDYKERFKAEYFQLKIRINSLENVVKKYKEGTLNFKPSCSYDLLNGQLKSMYLYLSFLKERADIENIELD